MMPPTGWRPSPATGWARRPVYLRRGRTAQRAHPVQQHGGRLRQPSAEHPADAASLSRFSFSTALTYNLAGNRLLTAGSASFTYDDEGQLATGYDNSYTFDYEHRLTGISGTVNEQFAYDGAGNRLAVNRGGVITRYVYDINGNLIAEADANNVIIRYYIYGKGLLAMATPAGELYCYHFDATGHTVALSNAAGNWSTDTPTR
jgi:YD repeat-containing protein